jgi:hypothetical protein
MYRASTLLVVAMLLLSTSKAVAQNPGPDPRAGTWTLNVQRSTWSPGPGPRAQTCRIENRPDGFTMWSCAGLSATGDPTFSLSLRKYDGTDYPLYDVTQLTNFLASGARSALMQASRVINGTVENVNKNNGQVTVTVRSTVSPDGRSYTSRQTGTNAQGQQVNDVLVFERVGGSR